MKKGDNEIEAIFDIEYSIFNIQITYKNNSNYIIAQKGKVIQ